MSARGRLLRPRRPKAFITNGEESGFGLVFATRDTSLGYRGISCFVVEKDTPGLSVGKKEKKTRQHCSSTTEFVFENCRIPVANLVGEEGEEILTGIGYSDEEIESLKRSGALG
ncbi:acyl-CoA dehydrogenase family protein [Chloroflexota bacterium]